LIADIEKFLPVAIFKMATTIPQIFNIVRYHQNLICGYIMMSRHWKISSNFDDIGQCWICAVLWWPFWKWRPVEIFQCWESIRDIIIYPHIKFWWYWAMLNFYRPFFIPCFGSHFENGRIAPLMVTYHYVKLYVSIINDVQNWLPTLKNFYRTPFSKWPPQYRKYSTLSDIIKI
jgi:hypothetical protein